MRALSVLLLLILVGSALPAAAETVVTGDSRVLTLAAGRGELIRLPADATAVFVANPDIATVEVQSPRVIYLLAHKVGRTSLQAVGAGDRPVIELTVRVTHDLSAIESAIAEIPGAASVAVAQVGGKVRLSGAVPSAANAAAIAEIAGAEVGGPEGLINALGISGATQVTLRVRIAEVSRSVTSQLGINWEGLAQFGSVAIGLATGNPVVGAVGAIVRNDGTDSIVGSLSTGKLDLNGVIDALANDGAVHILAEPTLTAESGKPASFLAGGEFPIPVPQGNGAIGIIFKQFGVGLGFTATVLDGGRISITLAPEVSQLSTRGAITLDTITIPAITTRRAETTLQLASGQSFAMAGLLQQVSDEDLRKLPGLGDVPILGELFKSRKYQNSETELVIIVTPYLAAPSAVALHEPGAAPVARAAPLPAFGDLARLLLGSAQARQLAAESPERQLPQVGFIVDGVGS